MDNKKKDNKLNKLLLISFIIFIIFYISKESGYYEYKVYKKTREIENKINEFEGDVKDNNNLTEKEYLEKEKVDYSCTFSNIGSKVSYYTEVFMNEGLKKTFKILNKLF